jgi:flagellar protein FlbT
MALVLTLKPQERVILGGAVVRNNGTRSAQLMIETRTPILRDSDILPAPETPCERIYGAIQLLYIEPERRDSTMKLYLDLIGETVTVAPSLSPALEEISCLVIGGDYYRALQKTKHLIAEEKLLLNLASVSA